MRNSAVYVLKGMMWGAVLFLLMQMCVACGTTARHGESMALSAIDRASVEVERDSIDYVLLAKTMRQISIEGKSNQQTERIRFSAPDTQGNQYITSVECTHTLNELTAEERNNNTLMVECKRMQTRIDSLQERVRKMEQRKEETKKTSGGVFSWSGKEVAAILALVLLIIIAWICIKTRGFI